MIAIRLYFVLRLRRLACSGMDSMFLMMLLRRAANTLIQTAVGDACAVLKNPCGLISAPPDAGYVTVSRFSCRSPVFNVDRGVQIFYLQRFFRMLIHAPETYGNAPQILWITPADSERNQWHDID